MSTYDLRCRACGKDFDVFVRGFLKDGDKVCPDCGGHEVEQRFTGFGGIIGLGAATQSCYSDCRPNACAASSGFS